MSNHPNRRQGDATRPTVEQIREARAGAELSQAAAAGVILYSARAWQDWEQGRRSMPRALFDLFVAIVRDTDAPLEPYRARARAAARP